MKSSRALAAVLSCLLAAGLVGAAPAVAAPRFTDVPTSHVFTKEIAWLADEGISTGYTDGTFRPGAPVLREQMAAFLHRFAGSPAVTYAVTPFSDVATGHAFVRPISWMNSTRITTGYDGGREGLLFKGADPVLREQMAAFLYRAAGSPQVDDVPTASPFTDIATSHPFYRQIVWLAGTGITTGYANGDGTKSFSPSQPVLREQMAAFLFRFDALLTREADLDTSLVSVLPDGNVDRGKSSAAQVTGDGKHVVFVSETPFFELDDDFGFAPDVFLKDRTTGELREAPDEVTAGSPFAGLTFARVYDPVVSDDASTVLYRGYTEDSQVFGSPSYAALWDTEADSVDLLPFSADVTGYAVTGDGREVVFTSRRDPSTGEPLTDTHLFAWDRESGGVSRIDTSVTNGVPVTGVREIDLSSDGRFIAFSSSAGDLVEDDTTARAKVFVLDRDSTGASAVRRVSIPAPTPTDTDDISVSVADDGSVAYESSTPAPAIGDLTGSHDVRLWDSATGTTTLVSHDDQGQEGNAWSEQPQISADGETVVFVTRASDVSGVSGPSVSLLWSRSDDGVTIVDRDYWGGAASGRSYDPSVSDHGSTVVFTSEAMDLVPFDLIGYRDIYAWDRPEAG